MWQSTIVKTPHFFKFHAKSQVQVQKKEPSGLARLEMERDGGRSQLFQWQWQWKGSWVEHWDDMCYNSDLGVFLVYLMFIY